MRSSFLSFTGDEVFFLADEFLFFLPKMSLVVSSSLSLSITNLFFLLIDLTGKSNSIDSFSSTLIESSTFGSGSFSGSIFSSSFLFSSPTEASVNFTFLSFSFPLECSVFSTLLLEGSPCSPAKHRAAGLFPLTSVAGGEEPIGGESEDPGTWGPGRAQIFNSPLFLRSGLRQFLQLPQFGLWHSAHCLHGLGIFTTEYLLRSVIKLCK